MLAWCPCHLQEQQQPPQVVVTVPSGLLHLASQAVSRQLLLVVWTPTALQQLLGLQMLMCRRLGTLTAALCDGSSAGEVGCSLSGGCLGVVALRSSVYVHVYVCVLTEPSSVTGVKGLGCQPQHCAHVHVSRVTLF